MRQGYVSTTFHDSQRQHVEVVLCLRLSAWFSLRFLLAGDVLVRGHVAFRLGMLSGEFTGRWSILEHYQALGPGTLNRRESSRWLLGIPQVTNVGPAVSCRKMTSGFCGVIGWASIKLSPVAKGKNPQRELQEGITEG